MNAKLLQALIDDLPNNDYDPKNGPCGGIVDLPIGHWKLDVPINCKRGLHIRGQSHEATKLIPMHSGPVFQYFDRGRTYPDDLQFSNFGIIGNGGQSGIEVATGSAEVQAVAVKINNVHVHNQKYGILIAQGIGCSITNSLLTNCATYGVFLDYQVASTTSTTIQSTYATLCGEAGFYFDYGGYVNCVACGSDSGKIGYYFGNTLTGSLIACGAEQNTVCGVMCRDTKSALINAHIISALEIENMHGVILQRAEKTTLLNCLINHTKALSGFGVQIIEQRGLTRDINSTYLGKIEEKPYNLPKAVTT